MNVLDFFEYKQKSIKISMVTCYDAAFAAILNDSPIDCILVGDSLAMVMHGYPNTLAATVEWMALHTAAVVRGAPDKFVIADFPFLAHRKGILEGMNTVQALMATGAQAVKIEGVYGHEDFIRHVVQSGVPVMGHLGLTPQSVHQFGGFKVQGREKNATELLTEQAQILEDCGCFAVVLECVPAQVATDVSQKLKIPTIGIGAGAGTDGQVLVLHDLLGLNTRFKPKFVRQYASGAEMVREAIARYDRDVKQNEFPSMQESYT